MIYFQREGKGSREGKKHRCMRDTTLMVAFCMPLAGDLAHNPGMCPDWELNADQGSFHLATPAMARLNGFKLELGGWLLLSAFFP